MAINILAGFHPLSKPEVAEEVSPLKKILRRCPEQTAYLCNFMMSSFSISDYNNLVF